MVNKGTLFLIPTLISAESEISVLSTSVIEVLPSIRFFLAEDVRSARRYFSRLKIYPSIEALNFSVLDKDTRQEDLSTLMAPLSLGNDMGVISEAGCPGIADPGSLAVRYAHQLGHKVVPLVGPSSILLALMASGLNGQRFAFNGYLPVGDEAGGAIRSFEKASRAADQTQIFIETPYRNNAIFQQLIRHLANDTALCVALDLTGREAYTMTRPVVEWRAADVSWPKKPAVFLFLAAGR